MSSTSSAEHQSIATPIPDSERKKIHVRVAGVAPELSRIDKPFRLPVDVTNLSNQVISSGYPDRVFLAYHWVDSEGSYAPYEGVRTKLPGCIDTGETCSLTMKIQPPHQPGHYILQVGLLQKKVSWFESGDSEHLQEIEFEVQDNNKRAALNKVARYAQDRPVKVDTPPAIYSFELTNQCPFKCIMCARTNNMTRTEGNMSFATFSRAVDELVDLNPGYVRNNEVLLHGFGESLVHPEVARFIRYANNKGLSVGLSINPLMLTKKVADQLLDAAPSHLYIALDGHDDESFEKIRGVKNAYDKSKRQLLKFLEDKKRRGVDIEITLSMIDFPNNRGSISELKDFWNSHDGIDEFIAKPFVTWDGKAEDVNILLSSADKPEPKESSVLCRFPWSKMTVSWDGDLVPCCFDYNKRYSLGNIDKESLADIWNGEKMQALRTEFINNKVTNPLCNGCEYLYQDIVPAT